MKWLDRFKKRAPVKDERHYCQGCGGIKTRQTTLDEWDPNVFLPKGQKKITDYVKPDYTTEKVGMKSEKRKYRGNT